MDYTPRYPQPFTLWEATQMDVPIITEEIARLQNSIDHLKRTQSSLQEAIDESSDSDCVQAMEENAGVIGSQEERISILRMALRQKGVPAAAHCANGTHPPPAPESQPLLDQDQPQQQQIRQTVPNGHIPTVAEDVEHAVDDDGGIDL